MKLKIVGPFILLFLFFPFAKLYAQSGGSFYFLEPGVGIDFSERRSAFGFNFKAGINIPVSNIFLGVGAGYHNLESRESDGSNLSGDNKIAGGFAGYNSGQWRFHAGYYPHDILTWKKSNGDYEYTGNAIIVGMGVFLTTSLSFNLDYRSHYYKKETHLGTTTNTKYYFSNAFLSFSYVF